MKRFLLALLTLLSLPVLAALQAGDAAPDFQTQASLAGKAFPYDLKAALKKGPVVVYFFPAAYTGGCNVQAHTFAENMDKFVAAGASIIGVSLDGIARLNEFSADPEYCAGKVAVASDADGQIAQAYKLSITRNLIGFKDTRGAAIDHGFAERTTFVVTPDGKIAATVGGLAPTANVQQALAIVQKLQAKKP